MADRRDERDDEPKIRIVDSRMLSEEERTGKGSASSGAASAPPKLEIVGGTPRQEPELAEAEDAGAAEDHGADEYDANDENAEFEDAALTEEEQQQLEAEINRAEQEQFQAIEQRMGRPLTEQEKESVRAEMNRQAQAVASLEVTPILQNLMAELSSIAAVHMGLMPNPYTRLIARNDTQARLAIDSFGALLEVVKPQLDTGIEREFTRVFNDLKTNFVSITGGPIGGGSGKSGLIIH